MSSLDSTAQVMLIGKIAELEDALGKLAALILLEQSRPAWTDGQDQAGGARAACAAFVRKVDYTDDLEPGGTARLQGLIGASEDTLRQVAEVNRIKAALHDFLMCLDAGVLAPPRGAPTQRAWTARLLAAIGRARLNRRQATRSFTILDQAPVAASFFWGRVRKIIRVTKVEALALMEKRLAESEDRDPALRYQYEALLNLPEDEPLAQVQQLRNYPRVNLVFAVRDAETESFRKQVMAASPIFYPMGPSARAPEIVPLPDLEKKRARLRRRDLAIEIQPFLPAIRVHRYLERAKRKMKETPA
jgi:hypothetical protein